MVTDEQYDSFTNSVSRGFSHLHQLVSDQRDEITLLKEKVARLEQFSPDKKNEGLY